MVERGLLVIKPAGSGQRAYLTAKGLQALKRAFVSGQLSLQEFGDLQEQLGDSDAIPVNERSAPPDLRHAKSTPEGVHTPSPASEQTLSG